MKFQKFGITNSYNFVQPIHKCLSSDSRCSSGSLTSDLPSDGRHRCGSTLLRLQPARQQPAVTGGRLRHLFLPLLHMKGLLTSPPLQLRQVHHMLLHPLQISRLCHILRSPLLGSQPNPITSFDAETPQKFVCRHVKIMSFEKYHPSTEHAQN